MSIAVTGSGRTIAQAFLDIVSNSDDIHCTSWDREIATMHDRYFMCHGLLLPKKLADQTAAEIAESFESNCNSFVKHCDRIFAANPFARVCVMGSHSGFAGSYDGAYAHAKDLLHEYVREKRLAPDQQLVAIAPSIIGDTGMTQRREDRDNLERRRLEHPKERFLTSREVARMVHFLLYIDQGYTTGTVIRMHGGLEC